MRFLLDESADYPLAPFLRSLGHDTTSIVHDYPRSLKDTEVLGIAKAEDRILITNDKDFGELIFRRQFPHAGIILFRLTDEDLTVKKEWLVYLLNQHQHQLKQFIVISDRGVRIRRMSS
jgi:predicted nuclease of predicted toxin-antitoxin system